jgi:hypothetical protein
MLTMIWTLITSRLGGWIVGGLVVAAVLAVLKLEMNSKAKVKANLATTTKGYQILDEGYLKLYQERETIKAKADQQRRKLNELQQANDLDGLIGTFNNPGGVRRPVLPNSKGGTKTPATFHDSESPGTQYQEAP